MALVAAWPQSALEAPSWSGHMEEGMYMPEQCQVGMQVMQFVHLQQPVVLGDNPGLEWHVGHQEDLHSQVQSASWMTPAQSQQPHQQQGSQRRSQNSPTAGTPGRNRQKSSSNGSNSSGNGRREPFTTSPAASMNRSLSNRTFGSEQNARSGTPPGKSNQISEEQVPDGDFRSLKHQLQAVNLEDPAAVITVREIKNLIWPGATVEERLQAYFASFGGVKDVLVPRAAVKQVSAGRRPPIKGNRIRSSNVGWVVMSSAAAVTEILRSSQHFVQGVTVRVEEFRRSSWDGDTKAQTAERSSSSDSSNSEMRQGKQAMPQIDTSSVMAAAPAWGAGGPQTSPHHAGMAMVPDAGISPIACAVPVHWIPNNMPPSPMMAGGAWAMAEPAQMQFPQVGIPQVFVASENELLQAMPEVYDD